MRHMHGTASRPNLVTAGDALCAPSWARSPEQLPMYLGRSLNTTGHRIVDTGTIRMATTRCPIFLITALRTGITPRLPLPLPLLLRRRRRNGRPTSQTRSPMIMPSDRRSVTAPSMDTSIP